MQDTNQTHLNEATTVSDLDSISPRRFSRFGENFMRETISFAVSIVSDNNLQFFVVSFTRKLSECPQLKPQQKFASYAI